MEYRLHLVVSRCRILGEDSFLGQKAEGHNYDNCSCSHVLFASWDSFVLGGDLLGFPRAYWVWIMEAWMGLEFHGIMKTRMVVLYSGAKTKMGTWYRCWTRSFWKTTEERRAQSWRGSLPWSWKSPDL
jgi:hypothetical protein